MVGLDSPDSTGNKGIDRRARDDLRIAQCNEPLGSNENSDERASRERIEKNTCGSEEVHKERGSTLAPNPETGIEKKAQP